MVLCYFTTPLWQGVAIDAATGETVWIHSPTHDREELSRHVGAWSSGMGYWADGDRSDRVFWGTGSGYLVCVDAHAGRPCSGFGTADSAQVDTVAHLTTGDIAQREILVNSARMRPSSTPIVVNDTIVYALPQGGVGAWDARSGEHAWYFSGQHSDPQAAAPSDILTFAGLASACSGRGVGLLSNWQSGWKVRGRKRSWRCMSKPARASGNAK